MKDNESVLNRLASSLGRRDDIPNQELAKELADKKDTKAIKIVGENLWNKDKKIRSDCLKVLYEIGYINAELIKGYAPDFIELLKSGNNRLVWGGMIALSTIADKRADIIMDNFDFLTKTIEQGSVITVDSGIKALSKAASVKDEYNDKIFPYLMKHLKRCRPKEVAQHAGSIFPAVNDGNRGEYLRILHSREKDITQSQFSRLKKIYKNLAISVMIALLCAVSCAGLTKKELQGIQGQDFYFQRFFCYKKSVNKEKVFEMMKNFPVDKIMKILSHKYGINIDYSEFAGFITANDPSKINAGGLVLNTNYTWESITKHPNSIEFELIVKMSSSSLEEYSYEYNIFLKINEEKKSAFFGRLSPKLPLLKTIARDLGYSRLNKGSDDYYVNNEDKRQVDLTSGEGEVAGIKEDSEDLQEKIKQDMKKFIEKMPPEERKKFRDDIIKYLYEIIE